MSHMVIYRGNDGKPGYHQTDDIHDAVGFVEQMRNEEGVEHARIFRLEEVVFEYRPYYRVQLADSLAGEVPAEVEAGPGAAEVGPGDSPSPDDGKDGKGGKDGDGQKAKGSGAKGADGDGDQPKPVNGSSDGADGSPDGPDDDLKTAAGAKKGLFGR